MLSEAGGSWVKRAALDLAKWLLRHSPRIIRNTFKTVTSSIQSTSKSIKKGYRFVYTRANNETATTKDLVKSGKDLTSSADLSLDDMKGIGKELRKQGMMFSTTKFADDKYQIMYQSKDSVVFNNALNKFYEKAQKNKTDINAKLQQHKTVQKAVEARKQSLNIDTPVKHKEVSAR